jgi:Ran GTPase-activating protein (RanGAP) involved in mRNA processing and transport
MLRSNKELRYLSLNNNKIDDNSMKLLSDALQCNRSLQYLYLNNCDLKDECVPWIIDMMKENTTLTSIELVKNHLTEQGKMAIKEATTLNKTCSIYLDFTFHRVH